MTLINYVGYRPLHMYEEKKVELYIGRSKLHGYEVSTEDEFFKHTGFAREVIINSDTLTLNEFEEIFNVKLEVGEMRKIKSITIELEDV